MINAAVAGLGLGLSLIVAIGAQNAFVLRQGVLRDQVAAVVAVCAGSDILLITLGVAGVGGMLNRWPDALTVARWGGAAFLLYYAFGAARRAARSSTLDVGEAPRVTVVLTCLALTWLNPHVYLDTVVLLGTSASGWGGDRWWFGVGAAVASVAWFAGLGFGARRLSSVLARPGVWRWCDAGIAVVMVVAAGTLVIG